MTITRYFDATVDGHLRIAVVEAETNDAIDAAPEHNGAEISKSDLPDGFASWKRYTAHAYEDSFVEVLSPGGD